MKFKFLCILIIVSVILGCTKSQIKVKDSLKELPHANQYSTATILPINQKDKKFAERLQEELKEDHQYLKFIPGDKFREALFPWFEANTAPKTIEELSALLSKTLVKKRIESLGVELLIYVRGYTIEYDEYTEEGILCVYSDAKRLTHIWTTLWDLKEIVRVGDTDISFEGTVIGYVGMIPPFFIINPGLTEGSACRETAKRISNCLKGKGSQTDK